MPTLLLAASDFDPFQGAIIVIALLAGFIKWIWENWRMKNDAAQRDFTPPDPEEVRRREEAWQRQVGQGSGPPQAPAPPPPPQRRAAEPPSAWDELRKAWNELKEAAKQSQNPGHPQPPPRPQQRPQPAPPPQRQPYSQPPKRGSVGADLAAAEAKLAASREAAASASAAAAEWRAPSAPPMVERRSGPGSALLGTLQNLRHDPALLQQAVLLHEILGPPKALQSSTDPAN